MSTAWASEINTFNRSTPPKDFAARTDWLFGVFKLLFITLRFTIALTEADFKASGEEQFIDAKTIGSLMAPLRAFPHWIKILGSLFSLELPEDAFDDKKSVETLNILINFSTKSMGDVAEFIVRLSDVVEANPDYKRVIGPILKETLNFTLVRDMLSASCNFLDSIRLGKFPEAKFDDNLVLFTLYPELVHQIERTINRSGSLTKLTGKSINQTKIEVFGFGQWILVALHGVQQSCSRTYADESFEEYMAADQSLKSIALGNRLFFSMLAQLLYFLEIKEWMKVLTSNEGFELLIRASSELEDLFDRLKAAETLENAASTLNNSTCKHAFRRLFDNVAWTEVVSHAVRLQVAISAAVEKFEPPAVENKRIPWLTLANCAVIDFGNSWMKMTALGAETLMAAHPPGVHCKSFLACHVSLMEYNIGIFNGKFSQAEVNGVPVRFTTEQFCEFYTVAERLCTVAATAPIYLDIIGTLNKELKFTVPFYTALMVVPNACCECSRALRCENKAEFSYEDCLAIYAKASAALESSLKVGFVIAGLNATQQALLEKHTEPDEVPTVWREGGPFLGVRYTADAMCDIAYVFDYFESNLEQNGVEMDASDDADIRIKSSAFSALSMLRLISVGNLEAMNLREDQVNGMFTYLYRVAPYLETLMIRSDARPLEQLVKWIEAQVRKFSLSLFFNF